MIVTEKNGFTSYKLEAGDVITPTEYGVPYKKDKQWQGKTITSYSIKAEVTKDIKGEVSGEQYISLTNAQGVSWEKLGDMKGKPVYAISYDTKMRKGCVGLRSSADSGKATPKVSDAKELSAEEKQFVVSKHEEGMSVEDIAKLVVKGLGLTKEEAVKTVEGLIPKTTNRLG